MLTLEQQERIEDGQPLLWNGLTLYPVLVRDAHRFSDARRSILSAQQDFPAQYVCMRYLEALYAMDYDARQVGQRADSLFLRLLIVLKLALHLPTLTDAAGAPVIPIRILVHPDTPRILRAICVEQDGKTCEITPQDFPILRALLAAQNGLTLPDETANAELLQAEADLAAGDGTPLRADWESLLYAVAYQYRLPVNAVKDWTIRTFQLTVQAIDRDKGHLIAALVEASGGKYRHGNPFPSWKFDRLTQSRALIPLGDLTGRLSGTVEQR